jgi:hypothetical protein
MFEIGCVYKNKNSLKYFIAADRNRLVRIANDELVSVRPYNRNTYTLFKTFSAERLMKVWKTTSLKLLDELFEARLPVKVKPPGNPRKAVTADWRIVKDPIYDH